MAVRRAWGHWVGATATITPDLPAQRIGNTNDLRQRSPPRGRRPRDIRYQTRTPAGPGAAVTALPCRDCTRRYASGPLGFMAASAVSTTARSSWPWPPAVAAA